MESHIPEQHEGSKMDIHAHVAFDTVNEAQRFYATAKSRLLEASKWYEVCKVPLSTFILTDSEGNEIDRHLKKGDYLKIDIPGPGPATGDGFDWVKIESIVEEDTGQIELTSVTVRPASNPKQQGSDVAHFFENEATSTFQVKRIGLEVHAEVHGRNEKANMNTDHLVDNIRNTLIGWSAKLGFSYPQWKSLVTGLVNNN